ncbi:6-phosphogluconolactonase [Aeromicrobium sp. CF3.5]|uniref:6-phosphogluconolactonase n=1 Tax=Aeromicrobium sp. CF3.5 TaxID=3373078 RepID=UPI003EE73557
MSTERVIHPDADTLAGDIAERLAEAISRAQQQGREPHVVLTGGTIAIAAYEQLSADGADWSRVHLWWGDERFVAAGHEDRNDQQARDAFIDRLGIPDDHVHAMPARDASAHDGGEQSMSDAADGYGASLPGEPFDLVLLGLGPDGHVASLFPGFTQLDEQVRSCVEVYDSPKPPPERITLTFPALNRSAEVWFLVSGDGKADAVARVVAGSPVAETPASGVTGLERTLWILDEPAASHL